MTVVADSSSSRARRPGGRRQQSGGPPRTTPARLLLAGLLAALRASVIGLVACMLVGLLLAVTGTEGPSIAVTVALGGDLWLTAHQVPLTFPHGPVSLLPLGLTLFPAAVLFRAGSRLAADVAVAGLRQAGLAVGALAVPYACAGVLVGLSTFTQPQHAALLWTPVAVLAVALLAGGAGVVRGAGLDLRVAGLLPVICRPVAVAAAGASTTLVAVAAGLVTVMLGVHVIDVREITVSLHADGLAGVLLFLAGAGYAPNAVVFALGYAAGPGFSLGTGTVIAPWQVEAGPVPAFPLLAAVPAEAPTAAWLVLAGPVLAGVVAGTLLVRHTLPRSLPRAALAGLATGPVVGVVVAVLCGLGGGSLGAERLTWLGPSPLFTGLAVAGEISLVATVTAVAATWLIRRRTSAGEPVDQLGGGEGQP